MRTLRNVALPNRKLAGWPCRVCLLAGMMVVSAAGLANADPGTHTVQVAVVDLDGQIVPSTLVYKRDHTEDKFQQLPSEKSGILIIKGVGSKFDLFVEHAEIGSHTVEVSLAGSDSGVVLLQWTGTELEQVSSESTLSAASLLFNKELLGQDRGQDGPRGAADGANVCADAGPIFDGVTAFSTVGATTDGPAHPGSDCDQFGTSQVANDVWFEYTATCSGVLTVTTCDQLGGNATFDTRIAIYDTCTCTPTDADVLVCNDDDPNNPCGAGAGGFKSTAVTTVNENDCYLIRIGSFSAAVTGTGNVNITCESLSGDCPAGGDGDLCTEPIVVNEGDFAGDMADNTASGLADTCGFLNTVDEWYCYTATCTGTATATTCSPVTEFDSVLSVFDACGGTELACNDDDPDALPACQLNGFNRKSTITWDVVAGESYQLRVSAFLDDFSTGSNYELSITCDTGSGSGGTDVCADGPEMIGGEGIFNFDNTTATTDGPAHAACSQFPPGDEQVSNDVWYCWTAPCTDTVRIETCNLTGVDTKLAVYDGCECPVDASALLDCNDDTCGLQSRVQFDAVMGQQYLIRIGTFPGNAQVPPAAGGTGQFSITCGVPTNPACPGAGSCFASNGSPGCDDASCCNAVCDLDPFCCDVFWDGICAGIAGDVCDLPPVACCFDDLTCQDLTPAACTDAGGLSQGFGTDCTTTQCVALPCDEPAGNCQNYDVANALNSDQTNFRTADDFTPAASGDVTSICWWGAYGSGSPTPDAFTVTYFNDAGGFPGAVIGGPFVQGASLTVTGPVNTGDIVAGLVPIFEYTGTHAPVSVTAGDCFWVSVTNPNNGTQAWFWEISASGNGQAAQDGPGPDGFDAGDVVFGVDLAFCLNLPLGDASICGLPGPDNDDCLDAIGPLAIPSVTAGSTVGATPDPNAPTPCGTSVSAPGVWYTVVGTGRTITASTCTGATGYDSKLNVYCLDCDDLTCITGNDDFCGLQSQVSWCSEPGVTYHILVQGFGGATGTFELELTQGAVNCGPPAVSCLPPEPTGGCCVGQSCTITTESSCNGLYLGDDTTCSFVDPYTSAPGVAIPDNNPAGVSDVMNVADSFVIQDVNVGLRINHTWVGDLVVTLSKGATTVVLIDRPGTPPGTFGCSENNYDIVLDSQGTGGPIEALCSPSMTSPPNYTPNESLNVFNGMLSDGNWTLNVSDNAGGDLGTLVEWTLFLDDGVNPCPECSAASCPAGTVPLMDGQGDFSGWCMSSSDPDAVDYFVDAVDLEDDLALVEIFKSFLRPPSPLTGLVPPILIDFVQVCDDGNTVSQIYIADEVIFNGTGVAWSDYHWSLFDGNESWFDVSESAGFSVAPFTNKVFGGFLDSPTNNKAKSLDVDGGTVPVGGSFFPGNGPGELKIQVDLASRDVPISFTLKQRPTIPADAAAGACCAQDGSCELLSEEDCDAAGGAYQGDGTGCDPNPCPQPDNDVCEDAFLLSVPDSVADTTATASPDNAPFCGTSNGTAGGRWYSVIGTGRQITASLCGSGFDTKIRVYRDGCETLTCVVGNDDFCGLQSQVTWCAEDGVEYLILVHGFSGAAGDYTLDISDAGPCPVPASDTCAGAASVTEGMPAATGTNCTTALPDDVEVSCQANSNRDVWYEYTASCTGTVTVNTEGSAQSDTVLAVFDACGGNEIACDDDGGSGFLSALTFPATMGTSYRIRVASFSAGCGGFNLNISCGVLLAIPDFDLDGDVDLLDFAEFQACMSPGGTLRAGCELGDLVEDGILDLADFHQFSKFLHGPAETSK